MGEGKCFLHLRAHTLVVLIIIFHSCWNGGILEGRHNHIVNL